MTLEESKTDDDILQQEYGVSLITDEKLAVLLEETVVDFVAGDEFVIRNVNVGNSGGFKLSMENSGADDDSPGKGC